NVGGEHLEAALSLANPNARFAECGMISQYNATEGSPAPFNLSFVISKAIKMQGFLVFNFPQAREPFLRDMSAWLREGKVKTEETIENGIENAPKAFMNLFTGANTGKMLVKLA